MGVNFFYDKVYFARNIIIILNNLAFFSRRIYRGKSIRGNQLIEGVHLICKGLRNTGLDRLAHDHVG